MNELTEKLEKLQGPGRAPHVLQEVASSGLSTPADPQYRKVEVPSRSFIQPLLKAGLTGLDIFHDMDSEPFRQLHELESKSSALLSRQQMRRIVSSVRDAQDVLHQVKIKSTIRNIMLITKVYDPEPMRYAAEVAQFLLGYSPDIKIYLQYEMRHCDVFAPTTTGPDSHRVLYWHDDQCTFPPETFDLILTFGGDGTVIFASWLFQQTIPPVLSFSLGSLGFLTEFSISDYRRTLATIIENGYQCSIRSRFECTIMKTQPVDSKGPRNLAQEISDIHNIESTHRVFETYSVFNEVVVDRGPNALMTSIEMFGDREPITTAEADGLIISTPSGSTAYSLSAGGSLVHPEIPAILISPICPHTLSFRPLLIPESTILRLGVPYDARSTVWCAFDGKNRVELDKGDFITITTSRFPVPCIKNSHSRNEWFHRISETLH